MEENIFEDIDNKLTVMKKYPTAPIVKGTICMGSFWKEIDSASIHILAAGSRNKGMSLINLSSGRRWADPISVKDIENITEEEWERIRDKEEFVRINAAITRV